MNILIVEDEIPAARQLERLIGELDMNFKIVGRTQSVEDTEKWLKTHDAPDLIFMDIQLSDDLSFAIFEKADVKSPVIFTTAYDEYALQAFKVNSIDYLLKPVDIDELRQSIGKLESLREMSQQSYPREFTRQLAQTIISQKPVYKNRFLVRRGEQFLSIPADEILCFVSEHKVTFCITKDQLKFSVENTLEELDQLLDPGQFFRVSRQGIIHFHSIDKIHSYFNGKLFVKIKSKFDNEFTVSRERAAVFKQWLNQ